MSATSPTPSREVARATNATYAAFVVAGGLTASWASRIPQIRDQLELDPGTLGLVLLAVAFGSLCALPSAGMIIHRLSSRRTVALLSVVGAAGLATVAVGYLVGVVPVWIGFAVMGFGFGAWDVAMNVQGATVERLLGKSIMPRFHAGFSVGTVAGALVGAVMVALHVSVTVHLAVVAAATAAYLPVAVRGFVPDHEERPAGSARSAALRRWSEPRTLLIGVFTMAFAFAEGTGNDWIGIALIDGYGAPAAVGTLGFAVFLAAMTGARWFGTQLLDRYGRVVVVRTLTVLVIVGLLVFVFSPSIPLAFVGALLWGAGTSLGFPVGMSAASDDPVASAGRVSVVASVGYCAFLGGPPLIGLLGNDVGTLRAITVVVLLMAVAALVSSNVREPAGRLDRPRPDWGDWGDWGDIRVVSLLG